MNRLALLLRLFTVPDPEPTGPLTLEDGTTPLTLEDGTTPLTLEDGS